MLRNYFWLIWQRYRYRNASINPFQFLDVLRLSQFWSREQIERFKLEKVKELLDYAIKNTRYYKDTFKNLSSDDFSLSDLEILPLLTKDEIRKRPDDFLTSDNRMIKLKATSSGSSGIPMTIYRSLEASIIKTAGFWRFLEWWGIKPWARHVIIWGIRKTQRKDRSFIKKLKDRLINAPMVIDVFDLDENTIKNYVQQVITYKPVYIRGYVSSIKQFCQLIKDNNINISKLKPQLVIVTSEVLFPADRKFIEAILKCRVANEYGSRDGGLFAYECPDGGMHIQEEYNCLRTRDNNELVSTELYNFAMPMINYLVGDRVQISTGTCSCKRTLKLIDNIEGRTGDMIRTPEGKYISYWIFYYIIEELNDKGFPGCIKQFKIIQKDNHFGVNIIKGENFSDEVKAYYEKRMRAEIGDAIDITFTFVDSIEKESSGKLRHFIREY